MAVRSSFSIYILAFSLIFMTLPPIKMLTSFMDDPQSPSQNNRGRIPWIRATNTLQFSNQKVTLYLLRRTKVRRHLLFCFYFYFRNRYISISTYCIHISRRRCRHFISIFRICMYNRMSTMKPKYVWIQIWPYLDFPPK